MTARYAHALEDGKIYAVRRLEVEKGPATGPQSVPGR